MRKIIVAAIFIGCLINSNRTVLVFAESNVDQLQIDRQPLELIGENKKAVELTSAEKELIKKLEHVFELLGDGNNKEKVTTAIDELNIIIKENPKYADAYIYRALILMQLKNNEYEKVIEDVSNALNYYPLGNYKRIFESEAYMYSVRAKAHKEMGNYTKALDDLERAIKIDPNINANEILQAAGINPDQVNKDALWNKKDFDKIISKLSSDYRGYLFRGYFYDYFATFDENSYALAIKDYEEAIRLNPKTALCNYLLAEIYLKRSFWLKTNTGDDSGQIINEYNQKSIHYLDQTIALNPKYIDAYISRALIYRYLKQNKLAIKNYNKAIELDPNHADAYHDRGIVKFELGDNFGAIMDYDRAIEIKEEKTKEIDIMLYNNYKNRSDANMKVENWDAVIRDLTKMIKFNLPNLIPRA